MDVDSGNQHKHKTGRLVATHPKTMISKSRLIFAIVTATVCIPTMRLSHACTVGDETIVSSFVMSAGCLVRRSNANEILLVKDSDGLWSFPAGNLNCNENSANAAGRETREEAGVSVNVGESVCGNIENDFIGYCCTEDPSGQTPSPDGNEVEDAQWFTRDELDSLSDSDLDFPEQRKLLEDVVDGILC